MKTICLINFLSSAFVIACNFELSDIPYFNGLFQNAYLNLLAGIKIKSF
jgi:hypothetical protein